MGEFFCGLAMVAGGAYAHASLTDFPYIRQISVLVVIGGLALLCYSIAMMAMDHAACRR